ncbi:MAG: acyl-CoA dehydrogenase N-terminal domain-containing protein, partial [Alphaproteobacteria bacterium]
MLTFKAPLDDIRFVLNELFDYGGTVAGLPGYEDAGADTVDAVLEAAAQFCEGELLPLNFPASEEGCHFANGVVTTPRGFRQAYAAFARDGWMGICCDPDYGGQGLPRVVGFALKELICATNVAFGTYPGLTQ